MVCLSLSASQIAPIPYVVHLFDHEMQGNRLPVSLSLIGGVSPPSCPGSLQVAINEMDIPVVTDVRRIKEV